MIAVLLAEGFEEIEALTPVDLLRRAGLTVQTVSIGTELTVRGSHGIEVTADGLISQLNQEELTAIVLPGGMPGTKHLEASAAVQKLIDHAVAQNLVIGAICAAPSILGHKGLLRGKQAICFPGFEEALDGAVIPVGATVVADGCIVTAKGMGVATEFGLVLVEKLASREKAESLHRSIQCP
ncbi:MAG: DJ-1/PfpI family protein [Clostridia bacterium]|nr:DJ-1/PfpI family protein [Clostridia bacterium]